MKKECLPGASGLDCPLLEEYDFAHDTVSLTAITKTHKLCDTLTFNCRRLTSLLLVVLAVLPVQGWSPSMLDMHTPVGGWSFYIRVGSWLLDLIMTLFIGHCMLVLPCRPTRVWTST